MTNEQRMKRKYKTDMCTTDAILFSNYELYRTRVDAQVQTILQNRLNLLNSPASSLVTALLPATSTVKFHIVKTISDETDT